MWNEVTNPILWRKRHELIHLIISRFISAVNCASSRTLKMNQFAKPTSDMTRVSSKEDMRLENGSIQTNGISTNSVEGKAFSDNLSYPWSRTLLSGWICARGGSKQRFIWTFSKTSIHKWISENGALASPPPEQPVSFLLHLEKRKTHCHL